MAYPPAAPPQAPGIQPAPWVWTPPELTMSPEDHKAWWSRIELDRAKREKESRGWKQRLMNYLPPTDGTAINSNIHFRNTHLKIAETWAQMPELKLSPLAPLGGVIDPQTGQPVPPDTIVSIKRAVLSKLLGRDYANVDLAIREGLFDIYQTSGIAAMKICYQADVQMTTEQVPGPPQPMPGSILGLQETAGPMVTQEVPTVVNEKIRWYRFSSEKLGIPHNWHSTDYDGAPYLWHEFKERNTAGARRLYNLPDDFQGTASRDDRILSVESDPMGGNLDLIEGVEVWLRAAEFDDQEAHTDVFYRLVLIQGLEERPAIYEFSPYQSKNQDGSLTADSMIGNPIHPIVLRVASDMAWIPADAAFTDPLVCQENTWANQDILIRESNILRFFHSDAITTQMDRLKNLTTGEGVALPAEQMMLGSERLILPLPHLERAQSDEKGRTHIQRMITETLGIGANQAGSQTDTVRSATETATIQANVNVRLKSEQTILLARILQGVRKFDALIQRYLDQQDYVEIIGADGARKLVAYTQAHLAGRYAYDAFVDTQLTLDQNTRIKRAVDLVNFLAKSPVVDQTEMARVTIDAFGYDPGRMIKPPAPPPKEEPKVSIAIKAEDLIIPEVQSLMAQLGLQLPPVPSPQLVAAAEAAKAKNQPHGGGAPKADLVDKHHSDLTGLQVGNPPAAGPPAPQVVPGNMVQ